MAGIDSTQLTFDIDAFLTATPTFWSLAVTRSVNILKYTLKLIVAYHVVRRLGRLISFLLNYVPRGTLASAAPSFLDRVLSYALKVNDNSLLVSCFQSQNWLRERVVPAHTHGSLAGNRQNGLIFARTLALTTKRGVYDVQASKRSQTLGIPGVRSAYWCKDLDKTICSDPVPARPLYYIEDVDQHLMMDVMTGSDPVLLFHMVPLKPASTSREWRYRFHEDGRLELHVNGNSAPYMDYLWKYGDGFDCISWNFTYPFVHYTFWKCYQKDTSIPDWKLTFIVPQVVGGPLACLAMSLKTSFARSPLTKFNPVNDQRTLASIYDPVESVTRVAAISPNVWTSQVYEPAQVTAIGTLALTTVAPSAASYNSRINKSELTQADTAIVDSNFSGDALTVSAPTKVNKAFACLPLLHYSFAGDDAVPCPVGIPLCSSFVPTYIPDRDLDTMEHAIKTRVIDLQQPPAPLDSHVVDAFLEFLDWTFKNFKGTLVPYTVEEVAERQNAPRQRDNLNQGLDLAEREPDFKPFEKVEPYPYAADPRVITGVNPIHKLKWSAFVYAIADVLKTMTWYAFGKQQVEIASHVADICRDADSTQNGDLSRQDGRINSGVRGLEKLFIGYLFKPEFLELAYREHENAFGNTCRYYGKSYKQHYSRASGDPETSCFNSMISAFIIYLAYKHANSPPTNKLGQPRFMVGGDDSISADLPDEEFRVAAEAVGQCPKPCLIRRGNIGVNFLARFYSTAVWDGDCNSCCDPERALRNLSFTANLPQTTPSKKLARLYEKAWAKLLTDANTPFIGPICQAIVDYYERCFPRKKLTEQTLRLALKEDVGWWACNQCESGHFPNDGADDFGMHVIEWKKTFVPDERILLSIISGIGQGKFDELPCFEAVAQQPPVAPVRINANMVAENPCNAPAPVSEPSKPDKKGKSRSTPAEPKASAPAPASVKKTAQKPKGKQPKKAAGVANSASKPVPKKEPRAPKAEKPKASAGKQRPVAQG